MNRQLKQSLLPSAGNPEKKTPMKLDLIMNTDVSTFMRSQKKEPVSPHPFALQKFPSQHSEHVTRTSTGELLFLLALHS